MGEGGGPLWREALRQMGRDGWIGLGWPAQLGGNPNPGMWMTGGGRRLLQRSGPGVLHADLQACRDYANGLKSAKGVTADTLLILGEHDRMTPVRAAENVAKTLRGSRIRKLAGVGHMMMAEDPNGVLDALIGLARQ